MQEAKALTQRIRRQLELGDQQCAEALVAGVPPIMIAQAILQTWAKAVVRINNAEITDSMWKHMVAPRLEAILNGGAS
jgi:hypothetical protein